MLNTKNPYEKLKTTPLGEEELKIVENLLCMLDRNYYLFTLGFILFDWQSDVINSHHKRKSILASRQAGKSTVVSAIPCHTAKYYPKSTSLILAPTETQAGLNMAKVKDFIALDTNYPKIIRNSDSMIELDNGSRIYVVPATDKAARGYSKPRAIILDEASRIEDVVYTSGIRPMLTDNKECELVILSTPYGKRGFFYESISKSYWDKYFVRTPFDVYVDNQGIEDVYKINDDELKRLEKIYSKKSIKFYISDRHYSIDEQRENLFEMGRLQYRQEYLCEFVDPLDNVFAYEDIDYLRNSQGIALEINGIELGEEDNMQNVVNGIFGAYNG